MVANIDRDLVQSHLRMAKAEARNSFEEFDALWAAFNVMYEAFYEQGRNEKDMAKACALTLRPEARQQTLSAANIEALTSIAPVFRERDWHREGVKNTQEFDTLVKSLKAHSKHVVSGDPLDALVGLLYVVRCNRFHGFKTPERPRDREVLDAAVPPLRTVVDSLARHLNIGKS